MSVLEYLAVACLDRSRLLTGLAETRGWLRSIQKLKLLKQPRRGCPNLEVSSGPSFSLCELQCQKRFEEDLMCHRRSRLETTCEQVPE